MTDTGISQALGQAICAAWGIDPALCLGITIEWRPRELPIAVVELTLTEGVVRELLRLSVVERLPA